MKRASTAEQDISSRLVILLTGLLLFALISMLPPCMAGAEGFQKDYQAIDNAAKSVLMLEVYDADNAFIASGSGFVAYNNKTLITNFHVIENADSIAALSDAGEYYYLYEVLAYSKEKDIAILKFLSPTDLKPLELASNETRVFRGEPVVAIGSPEGLTNTVSLGNISAVRNDIGMTEYQFTAPISHGSSGGALLNNSGQVIGITYATFAAGQNLNMAIPIHYAAELYANPLPQSIFLGSLWQEGSKDLPTPAPTATPHPADAATAGGGGILTAALLRDGTVRLSWPEVKTKASSFIVTCASSLWDHTLTYTTESFSLDINGLIPGLYYDFTLQPVGLYSPYTTSLQIPSKGLYNKRDYLTEEAAVYWIDIDADVFDDGTERNDASESAPYDLMKAGDTRSYVFFLTCSIKESGEATHFPFVLALYAPDGSVYTRWGTGDIPADFSHFDYSFRMDSLLQEYLKDQQTFQTGNYWLELYFDGQMAAYGKFEVK